MTREQALAQFADMPIQFEVELDRRTVSLGVVASLQAGQILALSRSPAEQVSVRAGDTTFATGEIVGDGTRIKVRITRLVEVDSHR